MSAIDWTIVGQNQKMPVRALRHIHPSDYRTLQSESESKNARKGIKTFGGCETTLYAPIRQNQKMPVRALRPM